MTLLDVIIITNKSVSQEVQWIGRYDLSELSDVLANGKVILCLGLYVIRTRTGLILLLPPLIKKGGMLQKFMVKGSYDGHIMGQTRTVLFSVSIQ